MFPISLRDIRFNLNQIYLLSFSLRICHALYDILYYSHGRFRKGLPLHQNLLPNRNQHPMTTNIYRNFLFFQEGNTIEKWWYPALSPNAGISHTRTTWCAVKSRSSTDSNFMFFINAYQGAFKSWNRYTLFTTIYYLLLTLKHPFIY
jgi:hypothetical protein